MIIHFQLAQDNIKNRSKGVTFTTTKANRVRHKFAATLHSSSVSSFLLYDFQGKEEAYVSATSTNALQIRTRSKAGEKTRTRNHEPAEKTKNRLFTTQPTIHVGRSRHHVLCLLNSSSPRTPRVGSPLHPSRACTAVSLPTYLYLLPPYGGPTVIACLNQTNKPLYFSSSTRRADRLTLLQKKSV